MDAHTKGKLFTLIRKKICEGVSVEDVIEEIKSHEELIEASNSYCIQCGQCCNTHCGNIEKRADGYAYCLLHDDSGKAYPYGKKIPEYPDDIYRRLDPSKWAKPKVCHTKGPYLNLLDILFSIEIGEPECVVQHYKELCLGVVGMLRDYELFLDASKQAVKQCYPA